MGLSETNGNDAVILRYRSRQVTHADVEYLRRQCAARWDRRRDLFRSICEAWGWRQANGELSLYACCDLLMRLQERGLLTLPPSFSRRRPDGRRFGDLPIPEEFIALTGLEVEGPRDLRGLTVRPIHPEERLGWRLYVARYHYLGDRPLVGEHLLYAAFLENELVALLAWASAALNAPLREAYVGWDEMTKRRRLHFVVNNVRFLIPPWVRVPHLASKVLAQNLRRLSADWEAVWKHPVYLAETFVDTTRFRGVCYRAANWRHLGQTAGRSKRGNNYTSGSTKKALFVYPLRRHAAKWLRGEHNQELHGVQPQANGEQA
jgi:hypothetical protein